MNNQITYYQNKLAYEMDSWDLSEALNVNKNIVVIDTRSVDALCKYTTYDEMVENFPDVNKTYEYDAKFTL